MMLCLIARPEVCVVSARSALKTWALDVVPSLFPYMVFSRSLSAELCKKRIPITLCVPLIGLMGGSPSGAAALSAYGSRKSVSKRKALALTAVTGTISPMFFSGTLTRWTGDAGRSYILMFSQLAASAAAGLTIYFASAKRQNEMTCFCSDESVSKGAIMQSADAILSVGGCIIFFSVMASMIGLCIPEHAGLLKALIHGMLEMSGGLYEFSKLDAHGSLFAASVCGFGGLSLIFQNAAFLKPLGIGISQVFLTSVVRMMYCVFIYSAALR